VKINGFLLMFKKRHFLNYLTDTMKDLDSYLKAIVIIYPLFLFVRSILWAIRTIRPNES
jgi:hypothetical protein